MEDDIPIITTSSPALTTTITQSVFGPKTSSVLTLPDGGTFSIVVEPPTFMGWSDFNRKCEDLDSDFLMQPINEADYDSETQCLVDKHDEEKGKKSFYDHFVTKRKKKKGLKKKKKKKSHCLTASRPRTNATHIFFFFFFFDTHAFQGTHTRS